MSYTNTTCPLFSLQKLHLLILLLLSLFSLDLSQDCIDIGTNSSTELQKNTHLVDNKNHLENRILLYSCTKMTTFEVVNEQKNDNHLKMEKTKVTHLQNCRKALVVLNQFCPWN